MYFPKVQQVKGLGQNKTADITAQSLNWIANTKSLYHHELKTNQQMFSYIELKPAENLPLLIKSNN